MKPFITRPTEMADQLAFLALCAGEMPEEDDVTDAQAFGEAFAGFELFIENTPTEEGREALRQCERNLRVAFEYLEDDDLATCVRTIQETEEMFRKARKFIAISDE